MKSCRHWTNGILFVTLSSLAVGCATMPERIEPTDVSPHDYANMSCDEIREEIIQANNQLCDMYEEQRATAKKDEWVSGAGLVFFPAWLYLAKGEDRSDEIGRLKGETDVMYSIAVEKNCPFKEAIIAVWQERARIEEIQNKQKGLADRHYIIIPILQ